MRLRSFLVSFTVMSSVGFFGALLLPSNGGVDENQSRLCRAALPALADEGAKLSVARVARGLRRFSLTVDFRETPPAGPPRARRILCVFGGEGPVAAASDLVAIVAEQGPLSDAALFFLKHYWLDRQDAAAEAPPIESAPLLGAVSPQAGYALQQAVSALPLIAVTGLMATAYALVYGLVGRILLSFGEFAALGAAGVALGVSIAQASGVATTAALVLIGFLFAAWITGLWGAAAARLALAPVMRQPGQHVLILTVGLSLAISETIRLTQGHAARWLSPVWNRPVLIAEAPSFAVIATPATFGVAGAALLAAALLVAFMRKSAYGLAWRATADDAVAAGLCGVDPERTLLIACAMGCGVAGLAGFLLTLHIGGMGFAGGAVFGLKALVGAILGGVGSVGGAFAGGLALGALEALWSAAMPIEWRDVAAFALLSLVLIFRPGGFFGEAGEAGRPQGRAT